MAMLQKRLSRKTDDKTYYKWTINLPNKVIKKIGFKEGDTFDVKATKGKLILSVEGKKKSRRNDYVKLKIYGYDLLQKNMPFFHSAMDKLEKIYGKEVPRKELEKEILKYMTKKEMEEIIRTALYSAECFFPRKDFVQRI